MYSNVNEQLLQNCYDTLLKRASATYRVNCVIYSAENTDVNVVALSVVSMHIAQAFELAYGDVTTLIPDISAEEAILILSNNKDLWCTISFQPVTAFEFLPMDDVDPIIYKYKVVIANAEDLLKQYSKMFLTQATDVESQKAVIEEVRSRRIRDITLQLFTEDFYNLRERPVNTLVQDCTVEDGIQAVAALLDIQNVAIIPSDNPKKYKTFSIPPMHTLGTVLDFIQERNGVYSKGMEFYYTNETLYVYPGSDTDIQNENTVTIYKLPEQQLSGDIGYMDETDPKALRIVANDKAVVEDLSQSAVENNGNYQVSYRTDATVDLGKTQKGKEGEINKDNLLSLAMQNEKAASTNRVSARYVEPTNNAFALSSSMSKGVYKSLSLIVHSINPFKLTPGAKVFYHYEDVDCYKQAHGILSSVQYTLSQLARTGAIIYTFTACLQVKLDPIEETTETVTTMELPTMSDGLKLKESM